MLVNSCRARSMLPLFFEASRRKLESSWCEMVWSPGFGFSSWDWREGGGGDDLALIRCEAGVRREDIA